MFEKKEKTILGEILTENNFCITTHTLYIPGLEISPINILHWFEHKCKT